MSYLSQILGLESLGGLYAQQGAMIPLGGLQNQMAYATNWSALQNMQPPRPKPSENDEELWIMDSRDLTFEEWCADRFGTPADDMTAGH